jgi:hypothetical protein
VIEVEQYYESSGIFQGNSSRGGSVVKEKGREKTLAGTKTPLQDASRTETAAGKRMQELMRQFSTILRQASVNTLQLCFYLMIYFSQKKEARVSGVVAGMILVFQNVKSTVIYSHCTRLKMKIQ